MKLNPKQADALLKMVSKKVGTSPDELKKDLEKGDLRKLTQGMSEEESQKLQQTISNKALMEKVFSSPEAQDLIRKLSSQ